MKKLTGCTYEEFKTVLKKNRNLIDEAYEKAVDDAYFWIGEEYMCKFPGEYSISMCYDYVRFNTRCWSDYDKIYDYLTEQKRIYGQEYITDKDLDKLHRYSDALDRNDNYYGTEIKPKDYAYMEKELDRIVEEAQDEILRQMQAMVEWYYNDENVIQYAYEMSDSLDLDGLYVTDDLANLFDEYDLATMNYDDFGG